MKKKQLFTMVGALALVGALGIGSTLAFLQAQSSQVTNTFVVGNDLNDTDITLDETDVDNSTPGQERDTKNNYENVQRGDVLVKDPQVHIAANTADSRVFVKIQGLDALDAMQITADLSPDWEKVDGVDALDGVYQYKGQLAVNGVLPSQGAAVDLTKVFTELTVSDDADMYYTEDVVDDMGEVLHKAGDAKDVPAVLVKAIAVQEKGVTFEEALAAASALAFE